MRWVVSLDWYLVESTSNVLSSSWKLELVHSGFHIFTMIEKYFRVLCIWFCDRIIYLVWASYCLLLIWCIFECIELTDYTDGILMDDGSLAPSFGIYSVSGLLLLFCPWFWCSVVILVPSFIFIFSRDLIFHGLNNDNTWRKRKK